MNGRVKMQGNRAKNKHTHTHIHRNRQRKQTYENSDAKQLDKQTNKQTNKTGESRKGNAPKWNYNRKKTGATEQQVAYVGTRKKENMSKAEQDTLELVRW